MTGWHNKFKERNAEIVRLFLEGNPGTVLSERFGITRQRVWQILDSAGVPASAGGRALRDKAAHAKFNKDFLAAENRRCERLYGCSRAEWSKVRHVSGGKRAVTAYLTARRIARHKGVPWSLSLPDWIAIWLEACGSVDKMRAVRGRKKSGLVMARIRFDRGFTRGNVPAKLA